MNITKKDQDILRKLAEDMAVIAELPEQEKKITYWKKVNSLDSVRPVIWVNEIPWHEMNYNDELTLQTEGELARELETGLRRTLYKWNHVRGDMVIEPVIDCDLIINNSGFGISEDTKISEIDVNNNIRSREFKPLIETESDLEKITNPVISLNEEASQEKYELMKETFAGILRVRKTGPTGFWFAPWDELVRWWGIEKALMDLVLKPDLVHKAMDRLVDAHLKMLDQYEEMNLLSSNNGNYRVGSGGLGYTHELREKDSKEGFKANDIWGCSAAQIFSEVSPAMHEEFALQYELRWLERFGLNYYGCCEPLHNKIDILKQIPNLRKISLSPWAELDKAIDNIGQDYVCSIKPNPSVFSSDKWNVENAREELEEKLEIAKDCHVEILMKDISTVRYEPQRLWEWTTMAEELVLEYSK